MKKPNILVLFVDQLRKDAIGAYGNTQVITPALDSLAADSTVFTQHFCSFPVCTPSRYSFLSGLYTHQHGCWTNHSTLSSEYETFPRILLKNGYRTQAVGKMHFTPTYLDAGFQHMCLSEQDGNGRFEDDYHAHLMRHNLVDGIDVIDQRSEYRVNAKPGYFDSFGVEVSDLPEQYHSTAWVTDQALQRLESWEDEGECMMISYIKPHHPFDPSSRFVELYKTREIDLLSGYTEEVPAVDLGYNKGYFDNTKLSAEAAKEMTKYYYASITQIDEGIQQILDLLKRKGLYDSTLILFTADHGDYLGFHHMALKQNHMYDPVLHIPLFIKYPGKEGGVCTSLSDNTQVASAIIAALGGDCFIGNHLPLADEREYVLAMNRQVVEGSERTCYAVRSKRYKLLVMGPMENSRLFDLYADPLELEDVSRLSEYSQVLQSMQSFLVNCILFDYPFKNRYEPNAGVVVKTKEETDRQREALQCYYQQKIVH